MTKIPPFDPELESPAAKYVRLADHMQAQIAAGELPTRLSSEEDRSEEYHVSVGTVRKAAKLLQDRGLIETSHGRGTYLIGPRTGGDTAAAGSADDEGEGDED